MPLTSEPGNQAAMKAFERFKYLFITKGLPLKNIETIGMLFK